jgi:hypothetical protein
MWYIIPREFCGADRMTANEQPGGGRRKGLTDQQADTISVLVIIAAVIAMVVHFLTGTG